MKEPTDPIVQVGAPVLRQKAKPVAKKEFGSRALKALISKMKRALAKEEFGVAIAAPQVGSPLRVFVVAGRVFDEPRRKPELGKQNSGSPAKVFINPELTRFSRKTKEMSEGCLSVRGKYGTVPRHERVTVRAQDESGKPFTYHATGLVAQIFQHEAEHLEGVLFIDRASRVWDDADMEANQEYE